MSCLVVSAALKCPKDCIAGIKTLRYHIELIAKHVVIKGYFVPLSVEIVVNHTFCIFHW